MPMLPRLLVAALITFGCVHAQDVARMREIVEAQAAGDRFMGTVLVAKDDTILFEHSVGYANLEWKVRHTPTTKFRLGSVTKQFTAAAILLLEQEGKLSTDDPLSKHLPDAPAAWGKVTLHHLLTHTSGIPSFTDQREYAEWKLHPLAAADVMAKVAALPLEFEPGQQFHYCNTGYVLLGWVVARVSGQPYDVFLKEHVLTPLGLNESGYDWSAHLLPERAAGYEQGAHGPVNTAYIDMSVPGGAGGLYSTARDLHRWNQGLYGGKLLAAPALAKLTTPEKNNYACGISSVTIKGRKAYSHGGGIEGFSSHLTYFPESKLTIVVLSNLSSSVQSAIAQQLATLALGETVTLPAQRKAIEVPLDTLKRYVGVYELQPGITNTIRLEEGQLTTQLTNQRPLPIFPESSTKFFLKVVDAQVEFFSDAAGHVTHLVQYQNGRTIQATRIKDGE